ncbi:hypothetical protein [uncultured Alistipes sp.]|uniref:hypothetical protein n=1 Tax=uncultured Alistipes sp. TaxID=538949 RepID=UPI0025FA6B26|nr:hypothetical protein [uncultured Alistipes sp.]
MKLKRIISLLFLAVYMMATAGPAYVSLSCKCVAAKEHAAHVCCHDCGQHHHDNTATAHESVKSDCCGNHHSTEIELYTGFTSDNTEKYTRCAVIDLPPALMAEAPAAADLTLCCEGATERHVPLIEQTHIRCAGLRAPPVSA